MTWQPQPEAQWKVDPAVEEARRLDGWAAMHRVCGSRGLFFDLPLRATRKTFRVDAFTTDYRFLVTGTGATVLEAISDAHDRSGRADDETRRAISSVGADDFDELLGV